MTLYFIFTIEMTQIAKIINNPDDYRFITRRELRHNKTSELDSCGYVDDINHIISNKDMK